jgi:hypothetical protein
MRGQVDGGPSRLQSNGACKGFEEALSSLQDSMATIDLLTRRSRTGGLSFY